MARAVRRSAGGSGVGLFGRSRGVAGVDGVFRQYGGSPGDDGPGVSRAKHNGHFFYELFSAGAVFFSVGAGESGLLPYRGGLLHAEGRGSFLSIIPGDRNWQRRHTKRRKAVLAISGCAATALSGNS